MSELSTQDLRDILREAAGDDGGLPAGEAFLDTPFADLGFDSLALLETVTMVKRRTGVAIDDDELAAIPTPRALLDKIAAAPAGAA